ATELSGFDSENLVGVGALIQIVHKAVGDRTYDNVNAIMLPPKGLKWLEAAEADGKPVYVRVKDRPAPEPAMVAVAAGDPGPLYPDDDDDLPFQGEAQDRGAEGVGLADAQEAALLPVFE